MNKLLIKANYRVAVLNPPVDFLARLGALPSGADLIERADNNLDVVLVFVASLSELDQLAPIALQAVKRSGVLWVAYPKKTSKIKTDLSRDIAWQPLRSAGFDTVTAIAIDDVWSALRFRPLELVGT